MESKVEIYDLTAISNTLPKKVDHELERDNLLDSLESSFEPGISVVLVDGIEGIGKTTVLAQLCRRHPNSAISLFIKESSSLTYDTAIVRAELCNQINFIIGKKQMELEEIDGTTLRHKMYEFVRFINRKHEPYYIVIDGLDDLDNSEVRSIFSLIDWGNPSIFILVAHSSGKIKDLLEEKRVKFKYSSIVPFSPHDQINYLNDLKIPEDAVEDLIKLCRGIPSKLSSVRRILKSGVNIDDFINNFPKRLPGLFEIEWNTLDLNDRKLCILVAIAAFDYKTNTVKDLADVLGYDFDYVQGSLLRFSFISIDQSTSIVSFITDSFRKFAMERLRHMESEVREIIIEYFLKNPTSDTALRHLPTYLEQSGDWVRLLGYLEPSNFNGLLTITKSLTAVRSQAQRGLLAASRLNKDGDLLRFAVHMSTLEENNGAKVWHSELGARIAINDYEGALALANSSVIMEDRLQLLAIIARKKKEKGINDDSMLLKEIQRLASELDVTSSKRSLELACDLVHTCPEIAIKLIESITLGAGTGENSLDWAFATLSVASLTNSTEDEAGSKSEDLRSRIRNPIVKRFTAAAALYIAGYSASQVLDEAKKLENTTDQLYLLRLWLKSRQLKKDADVVIDYALNLAIKTTGYAPNPGLFLDLAHQLCGISNQEKLESIIATIDGQIDTIKHIGALEDIISLQLILAEAEATYNQKQAQERLINTYLEFVEETDLASRTACYARLMSTLSRIDFDLKLEESDGLHSLVEEELAVSIEQLLYYTADHNKVTNTTLQTFSITLPEKAFALALQLNTEWRRDSALLDIVKNAVDVPLNKLNPIYLQKVIESISDLSLRDSALLYVIDRLNEAEDLSLEYLQNFLCIFNEINKILNSEERCRALCIAYSLLLRYVDFEFYCLEIAESLKLSWDSIDIGWLKVNAGFMITETLAVSNMTLAKEYLNKTEMFRETIILDNPRTVSTYLMSIRLVIRAFSGLIASHSYKEDDIESIEELIKKVPSYGEQALLYGDLALRFAISNDISRCKSLVSDRVRPLIENISDKDLFYRYVTIVKLAPVLYVAHMPTALEMIKSLPVHLRDEALREICFFIKYKAPLFEPYDNGLIRYLDLTYDECIDLLEMLKIMERDSAIYDNIEFIVSSILESKKNKMSAQQKNHIYKLMEEIILQKLPSERYIKHNGYKIIAEAQLQRLAKNLHIPRNGDALIAKAEKLENYADRSFVLSTIATTFSSSKESAKRNKLIKEAQSIIENLPVMVERMNQYEAMAQILASEEVTISRQCLELAIKVPRTGDPDEFYDREKRIIDLAYRLDPDLASSLVSVVDDDPARKGEKLKLENRIHLMEMRKNILAKQDGNKARDLQNNIELGPDASWMALASLNANRTNTVHIEETRYILKVAAELPFSYAYPLFCLVIQNAVKRYGNSSSNSLEMIRPIFDATLRGAELSFYMATRNSLQLKRARDQVESDNEFLYTKPGGRQEALDFLRSWCDEAKLEYLKICDPYFEPSELQMLNEIKSINRNIIIELLTSKESQEKLKQPLDDTYREYWRLHISDEDLPSVKIVVVGTLNDKKLPIHDRWWVCNGRGLRIGTSMNAVGLTRESEISVMSKSQAYKCEDEISKYLNGEKREHNGERLTYNMFML